MRKGPGGASLRCRGCGRRATSDRLTEAQLSALLSWERGAAGDWCIDCQWKRGRTPDFVRRALSAR